MKKTYACSDVHSHLDVFEQAMNDLDPDDEMYIIGDVVDKGPDGLNVLLKIMNDKRCHMLIGNHDMMMLEYLTCRKKPETRFIGTYQDVKKRWLYVNGGLATFQKYKRLPESSREKIVTYLSSLPVLLNMEVDGRKFILVHAYPQNHGETDIYVRDLKTFTYLWRSDYIWKREPFHHEEGKIILTGHTPTRNYEDHKILHDDRWYDLDCGLAYQDADSRLGVLCLNDLSEKYYAPKR